MEQRYDTAYANPIFENAPKPVQYFNESKGTIALIVLGVSIAVYFTLIGIFPIYLWIAAMFILAIFAGGLKIWQIFMVTAPLYVGVTQAVQNTATIQKRNLLSANNESEAYLRAVMDKICDLPLDDKQKGELYNFFCNSMERITELLIKENISIKCVLPSFGLMTLSFPFTLVDKSRANIDKVEKLDKAIAQICGVDTARIYQKKGYFVVDIETPTRIKVTVDSLKSSRDDTDIAMTSQLKPVQIIWRSTGVMGFIGKSGSGKTTALQSVLYAIKKYEPATQIIVLGYKPADWENMKNVVTFVSNREEIKTFLKWIINEVKIERMREGVDPKQLHRIIVVYDDLKSLILDNKDVATTISDIGSLGAGVYVNTMILTQSVSDSGGEKVFVNCSARVVFRSGDSKIDAANTGKTVNETGIDKISFKKGDAIFIGDEGTYRIGTAMVQEKQLNTLPSDTYGRQWVNSESKIEGFDKAYIKQNFDFATGKFKDRETVVKEKLGKAYNGRTSKQLEEIEAKIASDSMSQMS